MKILLKIAKLVGAFAALFVLLVVLYFALVLLRKSVPFVFRGDIETLAASGPLNSQTLATEICGTSVDFLGAPNTPSPATALPQAKLLGWRLIFPLEGTASVRIIGVGVSRLSTKAITGPCEAIVMFQYRFAWVDNGRSVVLESRFLGPPRIVKR
jgi:hypothetical protein